MGVNVLVIQGNLTKDPELKDVSGKDVCKLRIAVNTGWGDKEQTSYINVEIWGKQAETCDKHLSKGDQITAEGMLRIREYDGERGPGVAVECVANRVHFGAKKRRDRDDDRGDRDEGRRRKSRDEEREDRDWERSDRERESRKSRDRGRDDDRDDGGRRGGSPF